MTSSGRVGTAEDPDAGGRPRAVTGADAGPTGQGATGPRSPLAPEHRLLTLLLVAQVTMVAFESMAVSTAMPAVAADLDAVRSFGLAFSLMLSGLLLGSVLGGLWCDRSGPPASLLAGQALFGLGGLVCGAAGSFPVLLAGRVLTGAGGGLLVVALYVAIGRAYPGDMHPRVFGLVSAAWVLPAIVGPLVAGALTEHASWRWVFWCIVPVAAVTTALTWARRGTFGRGPGPGHEPRDGQGRTALLGSGLAVAAGVFQWGSQHVRPLDPVPVGAAVVGLVAVGLTAVRLLPRGTVRLAHGLPSVMASRFLLAAGFNGAVPFLPLMLTSERGYSSTAAGTVLMLGSVGWSAGSLLQARDLGLRRHAVLALGGAVLGTGMLLLVAVPGLGLPGWLLALGIVVGGLGMGLGMSTVSVLGLELTPVRDHGRTSAALQLSDSLGSALGIALTGALFAALHRSDGSDAAAYGLIWAACAVIGAGAWVSGRRCVAPVGQRVRT